VPMARAGSRAWKPRDGTELRIDIAFLRCEVMAWIRGWEGSSPDRRHARVLGQPCALSWAPSVSSACCWDLVWSDSGLGQPHCSRPSPRKKRRESSVAPEVGDVAACYCSAGREDRAAPAQGIGYTARLAGLRVAGLHHPCRCHMIAAFSLGRGVPGGVALCSTLSTVCGGHRF